MKLRSLASFILSLSFVIMLAGCTSERNAEKPVSSVAKVDLKQYAGKWYEIARFPHSFEKGCVDVTAEYGVIDAQTASVLNTCHKDGKVKQNKGKAKIVEGSNGSKLKVRFKEFPVNLIAGDYWVNMLDDHYNWVAVTDSKGAYLWILSRSSYMDEQLYNNIVRELKERGFKTEYLERTLQSR